MTSSKELIDLAVHGAIGIRRGKATSMRSRLDRPGQLVSGVTTARRAYLQSVCNQGLAAASPGSGPRHPEDMVGRSVDRKQDALAASDIAWLNRLPSDPAAVSVEDAATVRKMLTALRAGHSSQSDQRLVMTYWEPIKQHHDKLRAEHNLDLASRPLPDPYAHGSIAAVAEAMEAEEPGLDPEYTGIKARKAIDAAAQALAAERDRRIRLARLNLEKIEGN